MNDKFYELIVAMNQDGIIGITDLSGNQRIPWLLNSKDGREDMDFFRKTTMGHIIVMGRKTFESLPIRPLPGRITIVLSKTPSKYDERFYNNDNVFFCKLDKFDDIIHIVRSIHKNKRVFICGGKEIYKQLLPRCNTLHITQINHNVELFNGETAIKFMDSSEWINQFREVNSVNTTCSDSIEVFEKPPNGCIFKKFDRI